MSQHGNPPAIWSSLLWSSVPLLLVLAGWEIAARWADSSNLPGLFAVLGSLYEHLLEGDMLHHLSVTLLRVAVSFAIAMLLGVVIGIVMGAYRRLNLAGDALLVIALNVPALVTILLCYIWFGLTEAAAVTAVAVNKIPTVVVMVREGARIVDRQLLEVAQVYRVSRWKTFFHVYLPQLYPFIMAAARSGLSLIWKIVLVVELLGRSDGVGFQLGTFFHFFDIASILAYTLAFAIVILLIEAVIMRPIDRYIARGGYGQA
ncbi:ABC transporter permease [Oceanobacter kriegii]|uniref:ABC transporter permease n=1 Tax=Oceanobacter kriegii TaxID=64972 RepID=UPI000407E00A|nr:ABC transporter permease subunit [Oceanobacter kriegii]